MASRLFQFVVLLAVSWCVMTLTHEGGHIVGGWCAGGDLRTAEIRPWRLPYSIFDPNPKPLVTLWSGPILGAVVPVGLALLIRHRWAWFIANFCVLANGAYLAMAWFAGNPDLDTPKLLEHGASPVTIAAYCVVTVGFGYTAFRRSCIHVFTADPGEPAAANSNGQVDPQHAVADPPDPPEPAAGPNSDGES